MRATDGDAVLGVSVLGPLALSVDGAEVEVPGMKRRAVLALLAMAAPEPVSTDRLVDAIWPDDPPASGRAALQSHISRLRRHLGAGGSLLSLGDAGYRLDLGTGALDAERFASLTRMARARAEDDPAGTCGVLTEALDLWRGPALAELRDVEPVAAWSRALTAARLDAHELLAECSLRSGDPVAALDAATEAAALDPLRESSVRLLMRALAATGRHAEALRAGHEFRRRLSEETGLDASATLAALEHELASGDAAPPAAEPSPPATTRRPPAPSDRLLGRNAELAGIARLLATERLVTIVGPAGVGKTRLALELARHTPSVEVTVVELAPVTDAGALGDVLARALGLEGGRGDPLGRCVDRLQGDAHVLVVDNCEHLLDPVGAMLTALLAACPGLRVLATSRERLGVASEQTSRLSPLPMPAGDETDRLETVPSVALFLDRARKARSGYAPGDEELHSIGRIVRSLDGMPLAIELAAGRLSSMGVHDLEARLDRALDLLGGPAAERAGPSGRHRTLRAAVQWSYDLLPDNEQRLFRHLSVFPGGFDLPTAEAIATDLGVATDPATTVAHLVDSSMVVAELDGRPRYRMLDTLRTFGLDRLAAAGELDAATDRLLRWAVELTARLEAAYETAGDAELEADRTLRDEIANLRTAWRTARDRGDLDVATTLVVNLYWQASWRDLTEVWRWFLDLADDPHLAGHPRQAQVLGAASESAWSSTGDLDRAESLARRGIEAAAPGDERGTALSTWALADVMLFRGRYEEAGELAIKARAGTRWAAEGYAQAALGAAYGGDLDHARQMLREAEARASGPTLRTYLRYVAGEIANLGGSWDTAREAYTEAITAARAVGATFLEGISSVGLVTLQAASGDIAAALAGYRDLIERWQRTGAWTQQWTTLRNLADLLERLGDDATAVTLRAAADEAPESSAVAGARSTPPAPEGASLGRDEVLVLARAAIDRAATTPTCGRS